MKRIFITFLLFSLHFFSLYPSNLSDLKNFINKEDYYALKRSLNVMNLSDAEKQNILLHASTIANDFQKNSLLSYNGKQIALNVLIVLLSVYIALNISDFVNELYDLHDLMAIKKYLEKEKTKEFDKLAIEAASISEISKRYKELQDNSIALVKIFFCTIFLGVENYYGYYTRKPLFILNFLKNKFERR